MSEEKEQSPTGILYQCISCGEKLTLDQLAMTPEIKCPFCGYRVLKKTRPPVVKRVKARKRRSVLHRPKTKRFLPF